jgi:hypothetical protein
MMDSGGELTSSVDCNESTRTFEVRLNDSNVRPLSTILSYQF